MVSINSTPHDRYAIIPLTRTGLVGFITVPGQSLPPSFKKNKQRRASDPPTSLCKFLF